MHLPPRHDADGQPLPRIYRRGNQAVLPAETLTRQGREFLRLLTPCCGVPQLMEASTLAYYAERGQDCPVWCGRTENHRRTARGCDWMWTVEHIDHTPSRPGRIRWTA